MLHRSIRILTITTLALAFVFSASQAAAEADALFRVTSASAYARQQPCWSAIKVASVFAKQTFPITGRTADNVWFRVSIRYAKDETWLAASAGTVEGDLSSVPLVADGCGTTSAPTPIPEFTATPPDGTPSPTETATPPPAGVRLRFTITAQSTYGREQPDFKAKKVASLLNKQSFIAIARTPDGTWLQIEYPGATTQVWVSASKGKLEGDVKSLPVVFGTTGVFQQYVTVTPVIPAKAEKLDAAFAKAGSGSLTVNIGAKDNPIPFEVPYHIRSIYQQGLQMGNRADVFTKVGDCESAGAGFLRAFGYNSYQYNLGDYGSLQSVIDRYDSTSPRADADNSFTYTGVAAHNGFTVWAVLDSRWADRRVCNKNESPLECEYRLTKPAVAIIMLGSADLHVMDMQQFQDGLRHIVIYTLNSGTVPILSTFPGHPERYEQTKAFNWAMTVVAQEFGVPVMDLWQGLQYLPNQGMVADGFHMTAPPDDDLAGIFTQRYLENYGMTIRNLMSLQALDAVWQVLDGK